MKAWKWAAAITLGYLVWQRREPSSAAPSAPVDYSGVPESQIAYVMNAIGHLVTRDQVARWLAEGNSPDTIIEQTMPGTIPPPASAP